MRIGKVVLSQQINKNHIELLRILNTSTNNFRSKITHQLLEAVIDIANMSIKTQSHLGKEALTSTTTLPPAYEPKETELETLSTYSSESGPPQYETFVADNSLSTSFAPTLRYQVENRGLPWVRLPLPPKPHPIPVYAITPDGQIGEQVYESIRPTRSSGSCALYAAGLDAPVVTTTYRFGPGKPPKMRLLGPDAKVDMENLTEQDALGLGEEEFEIVSLGCATRSVSIRTHLGTFHWRHGTKAEKKALNADSLLLLERITTVALEGGKEEKRGKRIAQFIRNEQYRTDGTGRSTAGNGGRLEMDLREWTDGKGEREQMERFVVAGVVCMLKREVDRRRMHQTIIIAGGASGGG